MHALPLCRHVHAPAATSPLKVHVIPEGFYQLSEQLDYPLGGVLVIVGFLLLMVIDYLIMVCLAPASYKEQLRRELAMEAAAAPGDGDGGDGAVAGCDADVEPAAVAVHACSGCVGNVHACSGCVSDVHACSGCLANLQACSGCVNDVHGAVRTAAGPPEWHGHTIWRALWATRAALTWPLCAAGTRCTSGTQCTMIHWRETWQWTWRQLQPCQLLQ